MLWYRSCLVCLLTVQTLLQLPSVCARRQGVKVCLVQCTLQNSPLQVDPQTLLELEWAQLPWHPMDPRAWPAVPVQGPPLGHWQWKALS